MKCIFLSYVISVAVKAAMWTLLDVVSKPTRFSGVVGCAAISIITRSMIVCRLTAREVVKGQRVGSRLAAEQYSAQEAWW